MTAPALKATVKAAVSRDGGSDAAATDTRALASTATSIPHKPDAMDVNPPTRKATVVKRPSAKELPTVVRMSSRTLKAKRNCTQIVYSALKKALAPVSIVAWICSTFASSAWTAIKGEFAGWYVRPGLTFVLWMTAKLNAAKQMPTPTAAKMKTSTPDILLVFFVYGLRGVRVASRGGRVGPRLLLRACARRGEADIQLGGPKLGTRRGVFAATRAASKAPFQKCVGGAAARLKSPLKHTNAQTAAMTFFG